jgi:structural maintenance of chromosome 2
MGQVASAKAALAAAGTEAEQAKVKIGLAEKEIKEKEPRAKKALKEGEGLAKELEARRKEVGLLEGKVGKSGWDEGRETVLGEKRKGASDRLVELMEVSTGRWHMRTVLM